MEEPESKKGLKTNEAGEQWTESLKRGREVENQELQLVSMNWRLESTKFASINLERYYTYL